MMKVTTKPAKAKFSFKSKNVLGNILTLVSMILAAVFGVEGNLLLAGGAAAVPLGFASREIIKGQTSTRWVGNIVTYLLSALFVVLPQFANLQGPLEQMIEAIKDGSFATAWPIILSPILNELLLYFRSK